MAYNEASGDVILQINQIGPGDEGEYTCSARNPLGNLLKSINLSNCLYFIIIK